MNGWKQERPREENDDPSSPDRQTMEGRRGTGTTRSAKEGRQIGQGNVIPERGSRKQSRTQKAERRKQNEESRTKNEERRTQNEESRKRNAESRTRNAERRTKNEERRKKQRSTRYVNPPAGCGFFINVFAGVGASRPPEKGC
jgi:hypothetical protein